LNSKKNITEKQNPKTENIDTKSIIDILKIINEEDSLISNSILSELHSIEELVSDLVVSLLKGGRLIYIGSGTSGRLGVLDASECPPTFHTSKNLIVGVIAGGEKALSESIEGAEDDISDGEKQIKLLNITKNDIVVGITASGSTPFVIAGIQFAYKTGCKTGLITFNEIEHNKAINHLIKINVGPEIITGSTRMKSGTATKMILNMITTTAMIKINKTYGNLMVDLKVNNKKLLRRAINIVKQLTGLDSIQSKSILSKANNNVKAAIVMFFKECNYKEAIDYLDEVNGALRSIING